MAGLLSNDYYERQRKEYEERQKLEKKEKKNKNKKDLQDWDWAKRNLCRPFKSYFNQSLGITIESPEQIRQLEKQGTTFMHPDEYIREGKKIKAEVNAKKLNNIKEKVQKKLDKVKEGYSFYKEEIKKAGINE